MKALVHGFENVELNDFPKISSPLGHTCHELKIIDHPFKKVIITFIKPDLIEVAVPNRYRKMVIKQYRITEECAQFLIKGDELKILHY
jgi:hypothetical protein